MLRAPICSMSAYSLTQETSRGSRTSVTTGQPRLPRGLLQNLQALQPQPLERVGRRPRLEGAAAEHVGAASLTARAIRQDLLLALHAAGAGDDDEPLPEPDLPRGDDAPGRARPGHEPDGVHDVSLEIDTFMGKEPPKRNGT